MAPAAAEQGRSRHGEGHTRRILRWQPSPAFFWALSLMRQGDTVAARGSVAWVSDTSCREGYPAYMVNWHLSTCCRVDSSEADRIGGDKAGQLQSYIRLLKWKGLPSEPSWNPRAVSHSNPGLQTSRAGYRLSTARSDQLSHEHNQPSRTSRVGLETQTAIGAGGRNSKSRCRYQLAQTMRASLLATATAALLWPPLARIRIAHSRKASSGRPARRAESAE